MKLSVVILNYNVRYFLELCLKSVEAALSDLDAEIIVVDNNSSDDSCYMVKSLFPNVIIIENKENYGFSKGNNQGVAIAKGEFICILNPDTVVAEDALVTLLQFAEKTENLGIIGCRLIDGSGLFLPESKRNIPTPTVALNKLLGFSKHYYANQLDEFEIGQVPILVGAFMVLKKEVFQKVKGFDEDYFMYAEDIDLSYRIYKLGYENFYNGSVTLLHFKGESTLRDKKYASRFYGAMQIFYKKHFKSNIFYDLLVWIGIKAVYLFSGKPKIVIKRIDHTILVSNKVPEQLERKLNRTIELLKEVYEVKLNTEIVLDANMLTYKKIIQYISNPILNRKAKFKILPKNSNFIIGSDSSKGRGEVIIFEND